MLLFHSVTTYFWSVWKLTQLCDPSLWGLRHCPNPTAPIWAVWCAMVLLVWPSAGCALYRPYNLQKITGCFP